MSKVVLRTSTLLLSAIFFFYLKVIPRKCTIIKKWGCHLKPNFCSYSIQEQYIWWTNLSMHWQNTYENLGLFRYSNQFCMHFSTQRSVCGTSRILSPQEFLVMKMATSIPLYFLYCDYNQLHRILEIWSNTLICFSSKWMFVKTWKWIPYHDACFPELNKHYRLVGNLCALSCCYFYTDLLNTSNGPV